MPQTPLNVNIAKKAGSTAGGLAQLDSVGALAVTPGGISSTLNVTAAAVIKAAPGRLCKIHVVAPGTTGGALTINDLTTTTGSAASNTILSVPFGSLTAGQVIALDWPCLVGIAVTAVPTGGSPIYSISWM